MLRRSTPVRPTIIPPIVLENIERNADTAEARVKARRSLLITQELQARRETKAVEPGGGEQRRVHDAKHSDRAQEVVREEDAPETGDPAADAAYDDSGHYYAALLDQFGWRSWDGIGGMMNSVVHVEEDFDNAYWDGWGIWFGDGYYFEPFWKSMSVTFHEWTHGFIEKTLGLVYLRDAGANNESYADIYAATIEQKLRGQSAEQASWLIGAELMGPRITGQALRIMHQRVLAYDDPVLGKDPQRKHMNDYYSGPQDNFGVHINSGIPNMAYAQACLHRGGNAWETMFPAWFDVAKRKRVGQNVSITELAAATRASTVDLFGVGSPEVASLKYGWLDVGINVDTPPPPAPLPPDSPCEVTQGELDEFLRSPVVLQAAALVMSHPTARRFAVRARALSIGLRAKEGR
jgi:Zn-dependent metalloprotease